MKVLVLGGSGMLGHKAREVLGTRFETYATMRGTCAKTRPDAGKRALVGVSADDIGSVAKAISTVRPDVVLNCIGIVKQGPAGHVAATSIAINALFPHQVAEITEGAGARFIQISTDCVFSGRRGSYSEDDEPDPVDLYGRTKLLGETDHDHAITIRTSIIGRELCATQGLLEWFLSETGTIRGYTHAVFSGLTTQTLSETLGDVIADHPRLSGTWHVASAPISKYDLLRELADVYGHDVTIVPDERVRIDRSLDDSRFRAATGIPRPSWSDMLGRLASDPVPYRDLRAVTC